MRQQSGSTVAVQVQNSGFTLNNQYNPGGVAGQRPAAAYEEAEWLDYGGRWGTTVEAPAKQEWFARAENPVSRTWLQQVVNPSLFPTRTHPPVLHAA